MTSSEQIKSGVNHHRFHDRGKTYWIPTDQKLTLMAHGVLHEHDDGSYSFADPNDMRNDPGSAGVRNPDPGAVIGVLRAMLSITPVVSQDLPAAWMEIDGEDRHFHTRDERPDLVDHIERFQKKDHGVTLFPLYHKVPAADTNEIERLTQERDTIDQAFVEICKELQCERDNEAALIAADALRTRAETAEAALAEKGRQRIGDSELAGAYLCRAEAAEAERDERDDLRRQLAESEARVERLRLLSSEVVSQAVDYYTAPDGKRVTIEGNDGEKRSIVPDDALFQLRATLSSDGGNNAA